MNTNESAEQVTSSETAESPTPTPVSRRKRVQVYSESVGRLGRAFIAGGIISLSVFNLVWNLMAYRADESESSNWTIAAIAILFTCIVPLIFGFLMLFRSLANEP